MSVLEIEKEVAAHYARSELQTEIETGLENLLSQSDESAFDLLSRVDEFHIGGRPATELVCSHLKLKPGLRVLDVGCGIGGPARVMAHHFNVEVDGIDLTHEYIEVGNALTRETGLEGRVRLRQGSGLQLPYESDTFDRAVQIHVGMNISAKEELFREIARVLKPGGKFVVYDVMRMGEGDLSYPVPWATREDTSFLAREEDYTAALRGAGFSIEATDNQHDLALSFVNGMQARTPGSGPPPFGLHILMGRDAPTKLGNMASAIRSRLIAPVIIAAERPL